MCSVYGAVLQPPMLVLELCPRGALSRLLALSDLETLPWEARIRIGTGVACGVAFLHAQTPPVIHGALPAPHWPRAAARSPMRRPRPAQAT